MHQYYNSSQALKNQSELVQTPGLFDPVEQNRGRGLAMAEDDVGKTNIVDNHIVSH